jgi:hypothetical protein
VFFKNIPVTALFANLRMRLRFSNFLLSVDRRLHMSVESFLSYFTASHDIA